MAQILLFANNASSTLAGAITNTALTANLSPGSGAEFPSPSGSQYFCGTFVDAATGLLNEIVHVTNVTSDIITMVRAQEGTTAKNWNAGDIFANFWTAGQAAFMQQPLTATTGITGTNHTYASADTNEMILRSNSGAAMVDTLPGTSPGVLAQAWSATIQNNDASGLLYIAPGSGANLDGSSTGFVLLGPGQKCSVFSDGSNYWTTDKPSRARLGANTTVYVATTGSDSANNGIVSGSPFLTVQHAWNFLENYVDINGFTVTVSVAAGTYTAGLVANGLLTGQQGPTGVVIQGVGSTTLFNVTSADCFAALTGAAFSIAQMKLQGSATIGIFAAVSGIIYANAGITFGSFGGGVQAEAIQNGNIVFNNNYTIASGANIHWDVAEGGQIATATSGITITLTGGPTYVTFAVAASCGVISVGGNTFSGTGSGARYSAANAGGIFTNGGGATYLPGDSAGTATSPGWYA